MSKRRRQRHGCSPARRDLPLGELLAIVERTKAALSEADFETLRSAVDTLAFLSRELQAKGATIEHLRRLLFGPSTEKTDKVLGESQAAGGSAAGAGQVDGEATEQGEKPKRPGHGRNPASAYRGATRVRVPHRTLQPGQHCPACQKGKLYPLSEPAVLVRVYGMAPLQATAYECDRCRCNLCGEVFTAEAPEGVGPDKYDETAAGMVALLRYGVGLPFNRIEKLQHSLGIPVPASVQWQLVQQAGQKVEPAHQELVRQAAQGQVLHNDDTRMTILELVGKAAVEQSAGEKAAEDKAADEDGRERTGVYTTGVVSVCNGQRMALFFTGNKHAGENLEAVLKKRAQELPPPIQMSDLLSHNTCGDFKSIEAGCMAHSRRRYVEVVNNFPEQCRRVLETLREVYKYDELAREQGFSAEDRLLFHQANSGPLMEKLKQWCDEQIEQNQVEPNSGLGEAIGFMRKHWERLTLFLRVAGAPLDNNICERALKMAIRHRKNSLFYKTPNGAEVGDTFMSLIHTADLNDVDPFDYLVALQRHHERVADSPGDWMPWNYKETLARLVARGPDPPPP
jgi:hypothetical protein